MALADDDGVGEKDALEEGVGDPRVEADIVTDVVVERVTTLDFVNHDADDV